MRGSTPKFCPFHLGLVGASSESHNEATTGRNLMPAVVALAVVAARRELARLLPVHDDVTDEVRHHHVITEEDEDGLDHAGAGDANDAPPSALSWVVPRDRRTTDDGVGQAEEQQERVRGVEVDPRVVIRLLDVCENVIVLVPRIG